MKRLSQFASPHKESSSASYWLYSALVIVLLLPFVYTLLHALPEADDWCRATAAQRLFDLDAGLREMTRHWLSMSGRYTHNFLVYFLGDVVEYPWGPPTVCLTVLTLYWVAFWGIFSTLSRRGISAESFFFAALAMLGLVSGFYSFDTAYMLATDAMGVSLGNGLVLVVVWMLCLMWFLPRERARWAYLGAVFIGTLGAGTYEHAAIATGLAAVVAWGLARAYQHPNKKLFDIFMIAAVLFTALTLLAPGNWQRRGGTGFSLETAVQIARDDIAFVLTKALVWEYLAVAALICVLMTPRWRQSLAERFSLRATLLWGVLGYAGLLSAIVGLHALGSYKMLVAHKLVGSAVLLGAYWTAFILFGVGDSLRRALQPVPRGVLVGITLVLLVCSPLYKTVASNAIGGSILDFYRIQHGRWSWLTTRPGEDVAVPVPEVLPYPMYALEPLWPHFLATEWPNSDVAQIHGVKSVQRRPLSPDEAYSAAMRSVQPPVVTAGAMQGQLFSTLPTGPNEEFMRDWLIVRTPHPVNALSVLVLMEPERGRLLPRRVQRWITPVAAEKSSLPAGTLSALLGPVRTFTPQAWRVSQVPEVVYALPVHKPAKEAILAIYVSADGGQYERIYKR